MCLITHLQATFLHRKLLQQVWQMNIQWRHWRSFSRCSSTSASCSVVPGMTAKEQKFVYPSHEGTIPSHAHDYFGDCKYTRTSFYNIYMQSPLCKGRIVIHAWNDYLLSPLYHPVHAFFCIRKKYLASKELEFPNGIFPQFFVLHDSCHSAYKHDCGAGARL